MLTEALSGESLHMKNTSRSAKYSISLGAALAVLVVGCGAKDPNVQNVGSAGDSLSVAVVAVDSTTALQALLAERVVEYQESSMGAFVIAIDSISAPAGYSWLYSVNDSMGMVASDRRAVGPDDRIVWHLRKLGR